MEFTVVLKPSSSGPDFECICVDGSIKYGKAKKGLWKYMVCYELKDGTRVFKAAKSVDRVRTHPPASVPRKSIRAVAYIPLDRTKGNTFSYPYDMYDTPKPPAQWRPLDQHPATGQACKVLREWEGERWEEDTVFLGSKFACNLTTSAAVTVGWRPV